MGVERPGSRKWNRMGEMARAFAVAAMALGVATAATGCVAGWSLAKAAPLPTLGTSEWRLVEVDHRAVAPAAAPQVAGLTFDDKAKRVAGSDGCNRLSGRFTRDRVYLHFTNIISTMMACADATVNGQAQDFRTALAHIDRYEIRGDTLALSVGADRVAMLTR